MRSKALRVAVIVAVAFVGSFLLKAFVFQAYYVPSGSMQQTLMISDRFVVSRIGSRVNRGDIVVFYDAAGWMAETEQQYALRQSATTRFLKMNGIIPSQGNEVMVKRVIGLPGDTVSCCNAYRQIKVNGVGVAEPYLAEGMFPSLVEFEVEVPEGSLFLLGDNRSASSDSRRFLDHPSGGFVAQKDVIGRAIATVWPRESIRWHSTPTEVFLDAELARQPSPELPAAGTR